MELKIGDYVRTINGKIWIITSQKAISGHKKDIIKSSPRIIDLVEVGDYVNCELVQHIIRHEDEVFIKTEFEDYSEDEIKSIVTKEMYASVEYRVETN